MASEKILIIEDEKDLAKILRYNLEKEGYNVKVANDGETGLSLFQKESPNLVILDIMLPHIDGFEVCKSIRQTARTPILMLTAKKEEVDRVLGLELGADDYVTKPFSVREILARVKAILRRTAGEIETQSIIRVGRFEIDLERYETRIGGKAIFLSSKEFEFLKCLVQHNGKALTRDQLMEKVWGYDKSAELDTRTIDQHIARLREKLGSEADRIITVKNVGYRFKTD